MDKVIIIGAGGHAKAVIDSGSYMYEFTGFIDDNKTGSHLGLPIYGDSIDSVKNPENYGWFIAIGNLHNRAKWYKKLTDRGLRIVTIIDRSAVISKQAVIGNGNFIGKLVCVEAYARIGDDNIINTKSLVEHGCVVGNHCNLSTNAVMNGEVILDDYAFVGSSAVIICCKHIGRNATVGAGATVIRDVPNGTTVAGCPARIIKVSAEA